MTTGVGTQESVTTGPDYRFLAAAAALVAAVAHLPITAVHLSEAPYVGVLFIALEGACMLLAVGLLARPRPWLWQAAVLVGALAVAAYLVSRTFGLPLMAEDRGDWTNPLGAVAVVAETTLCLVALRAHRRHLSRPGSTRPAPLLAGVVALAVGVGSTGWAAGADGVRRRVAPSRRRGAAAAMGAMDEMSGQDYWDAVAGRGFVATGVTRRYYISAEEVAWNYAPTGANQITGQPFDDTANTYVQTGPGRIGSTYQKCLYRQYSERRFRTARQTTRPPSATSACWAR